MSPDPVEDLPMTTARRGPLCDVCHLPIADGKVLWFEHARLGAKIHAGCPLTNVKGEDVTNHTMLFHAPNGAPAPRAYKPTDAYPPAQALTRLEELAADAQQRADAATYFDLSPVDAMTAVLTDHAPRATGCACGWRWRDATDDRGFTAPEMHRHHLAPFLVNEARSDVPALVSGLRQTTTALHAVLDRDALALRLAGALAGYTIGAQPPPVTAPVVQAMTDAVVAAVVSALDGGEHR